MDMDTIVAVASAVGRSSISVLRVSGPEAFKVVGSVFSRDITACAGNTIVHGKVMDGERPVDDVLLSLFRAPHSFTGEDVIEISGHGGAFVTNELLTLVLSHGARMAKAGEFSKRAFLNGKVDLAQAEAIIGVIDADSRKSLALANAGLSGDLRKKLVSLQEKIVRMEASIEVNIDYPEYESENAITAGELIPGITAVKNALAPLLEHAQAAAHIARGINVAIVGRPNAGKSTLLNALLGEKRAIVTPIAGTTRDVVKGDMSLDGLVYHLSDTAGLRETSDPVEAEGVKRTKREIRSADIVIVVLDGSRAFSAEDKQALALTKARTRLLLVNKEDLPRALGDMSQTLRPGEEIIPLSLKHKDAPARVKAALAKAYALEANAEIDETFLASARQEDAVARSVKSLSAALKSARDGFPIDIVAVDLEQARRALGEVTGTQDITQVIDEVFSRFCVGK